MYPTLTGYVLSKCGLHGCQCVSEFDLAHADSGNSAVVVTAASLNHGCSLLGLLKSLDQEVAGTRVLVYDLNLHEPYFNETLLQLWNPSLIEVRRFPYSEYPSFFRVDESAGASFLKRVSKLYYVQILCRICSIYSVSLFIKVSRLHTTIIYSLVIFILTR